MPELGDAIKITVTDATAAMPSREWGTPAVVGESSYATKEAPKLYYSLADVKTDHGASTDISVAATALFAQGVRKIYAVAIDAATPGSPSADEVEDALDTLAPYASQKLIHGVCLAGITTSALLAKLKAFADANAVIFTASNAPGDTVSAITTVASALSSGNGFYLAHADSDTTEDVAAAALGVAMTLRPWNTTFWRYVNVGVNEYFAPGDVPTLETAKVNVITNRVDGVNRISNALTLSGSPKYIDVTRTKYYAVTAIQDSVASLRLRMTKLPYTPAGLDYVRGAIAQALEGMVRSGALHSYTISMPAFEDIADTDKANRILKNVNINAVLAGDIQTFDLNLTISV
mgnify:CR=1 FL=1